MFISVDFRFLASSRETFLSLPNEKRWNGRVVFES